MSRPQHACQTSCFVFICTFCFVFICDDKHNGTTVFFLLSPLQVAEVEHRLGDVLRVADLAVMKARLASMEHDAASEDVWSDAAAGQTLLSQLGTLKQEVEELEQ